VGIRDGEDAYVQTMVAESTSSVRPASFSLIRFTKTAASFNPDLPYQHIIKDSERDSQLMQMLKLSLRGKLIGACTYLRSPMYGNPEEKSMRQLKAPFLNLQKSNEPFDYLAGGISRCCSVYKTENLRLILCFYSITWQIKCAFDLSS